MRPTPVYRGHKLIGVVNVDPSVHDVLELQRWLKRVRCPDLPPLTTRYAVNDTTITVEECVFRYQPLHASHFETYAIAVDRADALEFWWPEHILWKGAA